MVRIVNVLHILRQIYDSFVEIDKQTGYSLQQ